MRFRDLKTTAELVEIYRFPSREACRKFLAYHRVPHIRRGRVLLIDTRDMDAACGQAWNRFTREHGAVRSRR